MKRHNIFLVIVAALALLILTTGSVMAQGNGRNAPQPDGQRGGRGGSAMNGGSRLVAGLPPISNAELTPEVLAAMEAGIMDEYHAYATYQAVIDQFGAVAPFTNIQRAEANHIDAWVAIFERYGVPVPAAPATMETAEFTSLSAACAVGAEAEIANFGLYDEMLDTLQDFPDMVQVVTALRNASEQMHLPAFERCATR